MVSPHKKKSARSKVIGRNCKRSSQQQSTNRSPTYKPLQNSKFYLHLTGLRNLGEITADILHLGGEIEEFLSKEVQYVIVPSCTNTSRPSNSLSPSTEDTPSPNTFPQSYSPSTAPPFSPNTVPTNPQQPSPSGGSSDTNQVQSPGGSAASLLSPLPHSPLCNTDPRRRVTSRAAALLVRAQFKRPGSSDVVSNARRWGLQVWTVSKLQNYLKELASHPDFKPRPSSSFTSTSRQRPSCSKPQQPSSARQSSVPSTCVSSSSSTTARGGLRAASSRAQACARLGAATQLTHTANRQTSTASRQTASSSTSSSAAVTTASNYTFYGPKLTITTVSNPVVQFHQQQLSVTVALASKSLSSKSCKRVPYIKVEDFAKKYRPLFKEISNWPILNLEGNRTSCPFIEPLPPPWSASSKDQPSAANKTPLNTNKTKNCSAASAAVSPKVNCCRLRDNKPATPNVKETDTPNKDKAPAASGRSRRNSGGYCELCCRHYTSLRAHLQCSAHQAFVTDPLNYGQLDQLITLVAADKDKQVSAADRIVCFSVGGVDAGAAASTDYRTCPNTVPLLLLPLSSRPPPPPPQTQQP